MRRSATLRLAVASLLIGTFAPAAFAIYGGSALQSGDPARKSVVKLRIDAPGWQSFCGGVIYTHNTIATAAHCLYRTPNDTEPVPAHTITIEYYYDGEIRVVARIRYSKLIDMALLTLESDHPKGFVVPPMDSRTPRDIVDSSAAAQFVFFGHGPPVRSAPNDLSRLDSVPVTLEMHQGFQLRMQHADKPTPIGTCGGDSGGPVMIRDDKGALRLVGIHQARGAPEFTIQESDNDCSRMSIFSTIGRLKDWEPDLIDSAPYLNTMPDAAGAAAGSVPHPDRR